MNELKSPRMKRRPRRISLPPNVPRMSSSSQTVSSSNAPFRRCSTDPSVPSAQSVLFDKQAAWDQRKSGMLRSAQCGKSPKQVKRIQRRRMRESLSKSEPSTQNNSPNEVGQASPTSTCRWESSPRKAQSCSPSLRKPTRTGVRTSSQSNPEVMTESPRVPSRTDFSAGVESPRKPTRRNSFSRNEKKTAGRTHPFQVAVMPSLQTEGGKQSCLQGIKSLKKMRSRGFGSLAA